MAIANRPDGLAGGSRGISGITKGLSKAEIKNIKAHAEYIKNNPKKFEKDPEFHSSRMKNDLEYKNNQKQASYVKRAMADLNKKTTSKPVAPKTKPSTPKTLVKKSK